MVSEQDDEILDFQSKLSSVCFYKETWRKTWLTLSQEDCHDKLKAEIPKFRILLPVVTMKEYFSAPEQVYYCNKSVIYSCDREISLNHWGTHKSKSRTSAVCHWPVNSVINDDYPAVSSLAQSSLHREMGTHIHMSKCKTKGRRSEWTHLEQSLRVSKQCVQLLKTKTRVTGGPTLALKGISSNTHLTANTSLTS